ncbi:MAG: DUF3089 domain-containing protein [Alistipes sp.]
MRQITTKTLFFALLILCMGATPQRTTYHLTAAPDYTEEQMWFVQVADTLKSVDVFYIAPTCIWDWKDATGNIYHHMDTQNPKQRAAVDGSNRLAAALFGQSCRFYAPYYRQITMDSWMLAPKEINERYTIAYKDVASAFDYYMKKLNGGRPFILAGHSQGAKTVIELLKHALTDEQYKNMVAAYVMGFPVYQEELAGFDKLKPAKDSLDCGVMICYNSLSTPTAVSPLFEGNQVCINPINWHTDATIAPATQNLGSVFFHTNGTADTLYHQVGVRIDPTLHALMINGLADADYYAPSIGSLFPKGNYHVQELNLYFLNLQKNIKQRIDAFYALPR